MQLCERCGQPFPAEDLSNWYGLLLCEECVEASEAEEAFEDQELNYQEIDDDT